MKSVQISLLSTYDVGPTGSAPGGPTYVDVPVSAADIDTLVEDLNSARATKTTLDASALTVYITMKDGTTITVHGNNSAIAEVDKGGKKTGVQNAKLADFFSTKMYGR